MRPRSSSVHNSMAPNSRCYQQPSKIISFAMVVSLLYIMIWSIRLRNIEDRKSEDSDSIDFDTVQVRENPGACPPCIANQDEFQPIVDQEDTYWIKSQTDKKMVDEIRTKWLKPPSSSPYNFNASERHFYHATTNHTAIKKMHAAVRKILQNKTNGFFVESGAFNGINLSNTLHLEVNYGWTGLLVEPDPVFFKTLQGVHRKAWLINSCLSLRPYAEMISMKRVKGEGGLSQMNEVASANGYSKGKSVEQFEAQCFPFTTILAAALKNQRAFQIPGSSPREGLLPLRLRQLVVDYWSLDIESAEVAVLKTIPWDYVYIKVITIEMNLERNGQIKSFLEARNFVLVDTFLGSFIHDGMYVNKKYVRELQTAGSHDFIF